MSPRTAAAIALLLGACSKGGKSDPTRPGPTTPAATGTGTGAATGTGTGTVPLITECNDGIDNDGDGLVDWQLDVGCYSAADPTEQSGTRAAEAGWTTFDLAPDSQIVYVSASDGDDANDGSTPALAVATPARGAELVRDGFPDFLLFERGDTWRAQDLGPDRVVRRFKSGRSPTERMVVGSYGDSTERPRFELDKDLIDDDGNTRSYLAVVGLALISYPKVPTDPAYDGATGGAFRFVGTGSDLLFEDNYLEYGEFVIQNVSAAEVRRNVVYRSYHVGTCSPGDPNGDPTYRPSGIFAGGVSGLLIEGNVWDENGWNPDIPEACATIYNHDLYLSGNDDVEVVDNLILRASSIGVKMASSDTGDCVGVRIENNVFAEGEIGISMGGNGDTDFRFVDTAVIDNVFTDIGRAQPTGRTLTWYIDVSDNDGAEIRGNLLVQQPPLGNEYGIHLSGDSNRDVRVADNTFHGMQQRQLSIDTGAVWSSVSIEDNALASDGDSCLVDHDGGFGAVSYSGNSYVSGAAPGDWLCHDGQHLDLADWTAASGESGATTGSNAVPDPGRNLDSYAAELGIGSTLADFAAAARGQSRHTWDPALTAPEAANYLRQGYGLTPR